MANSDRAPPGVVKFSGEVDYKPAGDLRNGARVLRELAADGNIRGGRYLLIGSLIMSAFCVEGFCQTYGPQILGDDWCRKKKPLERLPVLKKLARIGQELGVSVDYEVPPWNDIKLIFDARDRLAHPRPEKRKVTTEIAGDAVDPHQVFLKEVTAIYESLLEPEKLGKIAGSIDDAFECILSAAGMPGYAAKVMSFAYWGMTFEKAEESQSSE